MKLTIEIGLDNADFQDTPELAIETIFANIASRLPMPLAPTSGEYSIIDGNGNWISCFKITRGNVRR